MLDKIRKFIQYPRLTQNSPKRPAALKYFPGNPIIDGRLCNLCGECAKRCPSKAITTDASGDHYLIDHGQCVFCMLCEEVCPLGAVTAAKNILYAEKSRDKLIKSPLIVSGDEAESISWEGMQEKLNAKIANIFGRSLNIREVDSGSCNGCDYEINALNNPFIDVERFGIHFVASPRHADMLLVTGTAVRNMQEALLKTYNATPDPKLVVAVGACACSGGIFRDTYATNNGIDSLIPVDVYIPGCPPRPQAIVYGILKAIERI